MRLLIAEDELDLAEALAAFLERNQFSVDTVHDGAAAYDYASVGEYDAVILDIMMPKMDGLAVLKRLRDEGNITPVMLLTARGEKDDRIAGFDAGADDYLPKPFSTDELLSRLRAILRRKSDYKSSTLLFGDLSLDCGSGQLRCGDRSERLSGREFQVMELFLRSPRAILPAERIMERVWGWDSEAEINVVWVHISNLRKKLKSIGSRVMIRTSRGLGYVLEDGNDS
ncbi:MAG: response regulator transcription factor [Oscillospiraceae bacterium]|nr:response regulator transcription factor [Oscillospiraceae bacterium]